MICNQQVVGSSRLPALLNINGLRTLSMCHQIAAWTLLGHFSAWPGADMDWESERPVLPLVPPFSPGSITSPNQAVRRRSIGLNPAGASGLPGQNPEMTTVFRRHSGQAKHTAERISSSIGRHALFFGCRSEALTKVFLLTPRDTDVSWSLRNPAADR